MGLSFAGLKYLQLPEVTALRLVTPVLTLVFAAILLGERFQFVRLFAVVMGLGRVCRAGTNFDQTHGGCRKNRGDCVCFSVTSMVLSLLSIPFGWVWAMGREWVFLTGAGVIGRGGQILLTSSYRFADAGVLAPFTYSSMLWSILIGYFILKRCPR